MQKEMFQINEKGSLEINKIECRGIPEFKKLIERDKGGVKKGDYDGRRKLKAFAELFYIYLVHSPKSIYVELNEEDRRAKAKEDAELEDRWKPDKYVQIAEDKYISLLNVNSTRASFLAAQRAVHSLSKDLDMLNEHKEKTRVKLAEVQGKLEIEDEEAEVEKLLSKENTLVNNLMSFGDKIQKLTARIPDSIDIVDKLKARIAKEEEEESKLRGGGTLGNREKAI